MYASTITYQGRCDDRVALVDQAGRWSHGMKERYVGARRSAAVLHRVA